MFLVSVKLSCLFIADLLWSPAGNGHGLLTLLCVVFSCVFVTFPCGVLGQVWYLIVSIPDLYLLIYFKKYLQLLVEVIVMTITLV